MRYFKFLIVPLLLAAACNDSDNSFSITPAVGFAKAEGTLLESDASGISVTIYSNVRASESVTATIVLSNPAGLTYGVDYTTEPAMINNTLQVTIDPEENTTSFFVYPVFNGKQRKLNFLISEVSGGGVQLGQTSTLTYALSIKSLGCPSGTPNVSVSHDFNDCTTDFATPSGFIEAFEPGAKTDRGWGCRAFGVSGSRAPRASAFGGTAGVDKAWMIMNPVTISQGKTVTVHFWVFSNFSGPGVVNVKWSSDYSGSGNPLVASWTDLSSVNSQFPAPGSATWKEITATFTNICGEHVYLGFQFTGGDNTASASWDIDDLTFTAN